MSWWGEHKAQQRKRHSESVRRAAQRIGCAACGRLGALLAADEQGKRTCRYCGAQTGPQGPQKGQDDGTAKEG